MTSRPPESALLDVPSEIEGVIDLQWRGFGEPGTWLTGEERIAVVGAARSDPPVDVATTPETIEDVARRVAHGAATLTSDVVDSIESAGTSREAYVEVVGVVSRLTAIDTFERGIGREPRVLPTLTVGEPSRETAPDARRRAGWVPTVGAIGPPTALTAVRREATDQELLHGALYLSYSEMGDLDADRGLHRTQMELIAARVSLLNDCFF